MAPSRTGLSALPLTFFVPVLLLATSSSPLSCSAEEQLPVSHPPGLEDSAGPEAEGSSSETGTVQLQAEESLLGYDSCEIFQDMRMLLSSAFGFLITHFLATSMGRSRAERDRPNGSRAGRAGAAVDRPQLVNPVPEKRRFKLYCYAM